MTEFIRKRKALESRESPCRGRRTTPILITGGRPMARKVHIGADAEPSCTKARGRRPKRPSSPNAEQPGPSRRPGTSIYYGVRFRSDLQKWVAEIRVAEWKAVDKKVWLGTFETEQGAAHAVDLARKLLKCQKKHVFNIPCPELDAYSGQIPADLVLSDVAATTMFKKATSFIKRQCRTFVASFPDSPASPSQTFIMSPDLDMAPADVRITTSESGSLDSEIGLDFDVSGPNENVSDADESCLMYDVFDENSISVDDYAFDDSALNDVDDSPLNDIDVCSFEAHATTMSEFGASPTSSTVSCMTFDQWNQMSSGPSTLDAEMLGDAECVAVMSEIQSWIQGSMQGGMSDDEQCWAADQSPWLDTSANLAPLPGSRYPSCVCDWCISGLE